MKTSELQTDIPAQFEIGDLLVDQPNRSVVSASGALEVSGLTFDLLIALARASFRQQGIATFDYLVATVWDGRTVSDDAITQRVKLLRKSLGDSTVEPRYVESVRGVGYRLIPSVVPAQSRPSTKEDAPGPKGFQISQRRLLEIGTAIVLLVGLIWWILSSRHTEPYLPPPSPAQAFIDKGWNHLAQHQEQDQQLALQLFERALENDPDSLAAKTGISMALTQSVTKFGGPLENLQRAKNLASAVLKEQPAYAAGHLALASVLDAEGQIEPAIAAYERVLILEPNHAGARSSLAYVLQVDGQLAKALQQNLILLDKVESLQYLDVQIGSVLALLEFDQLALDWLRRADELKPGNPFAATARAQALIAFGRPEEAKAVLEDAATVERPEVDYLLGQLYWSEHDLDAAQQAFVRSNNLRQRGYVPAELAQLILQRNWEGIKSKLAEMDAAENTQDTWPTGPLMASELLTALGRPKEAIAALQDAVRQGYRDHRMLRHNPALSPLMYEPEFVALIKTMRELVQQERAIVLASDWASVLPELLPESETL